MLAKCLPEAPGCFSSSATPAAEGKLFPAASGKGSWADPQGFSLVADQNSGLRRRDRWGHITCRAATKTWSS